jgi:ABC-2 type transport system permease protein
MALDAPAAVRPAEPSGAGANGAGVLQRVNVPVRFWGGFWPTVREIVERRQLLAMLIRKELKVKYKGSVLGFVWTLLRPLFMLLIYAVAFGTFLRNDSVPDYVVFLFCGLAPWYLFQDIVIGCTNSIIANAGLIKKVYFPREILPLSVVGASMFQFVFQLVVLFGAVAVTGHPLSPGPLLLLVPTVAGLIIFATSVGLLLAAANVYLRDTQHLVEVLLQAWFFLTPIIYNITLVRSRLTAISPWLLQVFLANPMAEVALGFQRAVYQKGLDAGQSAVYTGDIWGRELVFVAVAIVLLWLTQRVFARAQGSFAQEL